MQTVFDYLEKDHDRIQDLLDGIQLRSEPEKSVFEQWRERTADINEDPKTLFSRMRDLILTHMNFEEKYFYPVLADVKRLSEETLEAYEEHHVARRSIQEIEMMAPDQIAWRAKNKVLQEIINTHVKEEEHRIFPHARRYLSDDQLNEMTRQYEDSHAMAGAAR
jgi:hemerythrin-like domain-containing protein